MRGIICLWSGSVASIPDGWHLCDGAYDTPDLRNRFVVGAGVGYNPGDTGGSVDHMHNFDFNTEGDSYAPLLTAGGYQNVSPTGHTHHCSGQTGLSEHLPPYYALCYIMKL